MAHPDRSLPAIANAEHIGPDTTGDNIAAKKTAFYAYDYANSTWRRVNVDSNGNFVISASIGSVTNDGTFLSNTQLRATPVNTLEGTGLVPKVYDALTYTATSGTVDTYKYYTSGTGGTLVATLTVTFTAADHATLTSVVRT